MLLNWKEFHYTKMLAKQLFAIVKSIDFCVSSKIFWTYLPKPIVNLLQFYNLFKEYYWCVKFRLGITWKLKIRQMNDLFLL